MAKYGFQADLLNKEEILKKYSEARIFAIIFGEVNNGKFTSPFRKDDKASCFFRVNKFGKLKFYDYSTSKIINGIQLRSLDCFDAIKLHIKAENFFEVLSYIEANINNVPEQTIKIKSQEEEFEIYFKPRPFLLVDKKFWYDRYEITREQLISDGVFAVSSYKLSYLFKSMTFNPSYLTYIYTNYSKNRKKIYIPYKRTPPKFITNCTSNDIGGIDSLTYKTQSLVITKSYKDHRVLRNNNIENIYFQSENMFPELKILIPIFKKYKEIFIIFDNDKAGIEAASLLKNYLIEIHTSVQIILIPQISESITDSSDLFFHDKKKFLSFYSKFNF